MNTHTGITMKKNYHIPWDTYFGTISKSRDANFRVSAINQANKSCMGGCLYPPDYQKTMELFRVPSFITPYYFK